MEKTLNKREMKVGDIVKPSAEWINQITQKLERKAFRRSLFYSIDTDALEDAKAFLNNRCYGIIREGVSRFSIEWLNRIPSLLRNEIKVAWWGNRELEIVEPCDPIWDKYITDPEPPKEYPKGLEPEDFDEDIAYFL